LSATGARATAPPSIDDDATLNDGIAKVTFCEATLLDTSAESSVTEDDVFEPSGPRALRSGLGRHVSRDVGEVSSGTLGAVSLLVGVFGWVRRPPLPSAASGDSDVVEPVDPVLAEDSSVDDAGDGFAGVGDSVLPGAGVSALSGAAELEPDDEEPAGSAHAIPGWLKSATPTPRATARPPIRPTYAA
jgi:hypothetical protein